MKRYPNYPGHHANDTSKEAAEAIAPHVNRLQALALGEIRGAGRNGHTREELSEALAIDPKSIEPRVSELKRKGLIVDSGQRRLNRSGKRASVMVAVALPTHPAIPQMDTPKSDEPTDDS